MKRFSSQKGFTLVELLIVISILAVLAAVVFAALDPGTRFQDARDARRFSDIAELLHAIKIDQVDNGGDYLTEIKDNMTAAQIYMIGTDSTGCDDDTCDATVASDTHCADLSGLVTEGYMGSMPISPQGATAWTAGTTGYVITKATTGSITIQACESENTSSISLTR
ncbi:MAG: type II secretion system protein [bacterium]|nr:type II secretion system protein [bacterium]MDA1024404.1 type II secretion system protein [bacterium]